MGNCCKKRCEKELLYPRLPYTPVDGTRHHFWDFQDGCLKPRTPITPLDAMMPETDLTKRHIAARKAAMDRLKDLDD